MGFWFRGLSTWSLLAAPCGVSYPERGMASLPNQELHEKSVAEELTDIDAALDRDDEKLPERVQFEMARLQGMGIIDERGELIDPRLPPDMREGSGCDLG